MALEAVHDFTGRGETRSSALKLPRETGASGQSGEGDGQNFSELVKEFVGDVNNLQFKAGHAIDMFVTGEATDVHQVMVAAQQAGVALDLMLEIRNRVLEGYQELIRMQV
jgi:flagellar hook-basal body complex protein FliE